MRKVFSSRGRGGVSPPGWFVRELGLIDERYRVGYDKENDYYVILLDMDHLVPGEHGPEKVSIPHIRAVFDDFDMRVIKDMQKRKWINKHFGSNEKYYRHLKDKAKEEKLKKDDEAVEMIADGWMFGHRVATRKTFS